jgi:hypothetical protein
MLFPNAHQRWPFQTVQSVAGWKILLASASTPSVRLHDGRASDKLHRNFSTAFLHGQPDLLLLVLEILQHLFLGAFGNNRPSLLGLHQLHGRLLFGAQYLLDYCQSGLSRGADTVVVNIV